MFNNGSAPVPHKLIGLKLKTDIYFASPAVIKFNV